MGDLNRVKKEGLMTINDEMLDEVVGGTGVGVTGASVPEICPNCGKKIWDSSVRGAVPPTDCPHCNAHIWGRQSQANLKRPEQSNARTMKPVSDLGQHFS